MTDRERLSAYESQLNYIANLVDALQIVNSDFAQVQIEGQRLSQIRSAVVGLGDSLENLLVKEV